MNKVLVWDLPIRVFHWAFAGSILAAFAIAFGVDDDNPLFQLHMLFGIVAVFLVVFRLILGVVGSRHARFWNLPLSPREAVSYFTGVLTGKAKTYAGNNPGSALAALAMLALVPAIAFTGIGAGGEALEDVHGALAYILLAVIGAHLLGLVLHSLRHRENIALAMITGRKQVEPSEGIRSAHPIWGVGLLLGAAAWVIALFSSHDANAATVRVPLLGAVVQLGENEGKERGESEGHGKRGGGEHGEGHRDHDDD